MIWKIINTLIALLIATNLFAFSGDGSVTNPYIISNTNDLVLLAFDVNSKGNSYTGKSFELNNNIDLSSINNWEPIGKDMKRSFQGILDGKGFQVLNLTINGTADCMGLFGYLQRATIKNLSVKGVVKGRSRIGGIAANAIYSTIANCNNEVSITALDKYAGGVVAIAIKSEVTNSSNKGFVKAKGSADPIVGLSYNPDRIFTLHDNRNGISGLKPEYIDIPFIYVPSTIEGISIKRIYDAAFKENENIEEFAIADGSFTTFHPSVFQGCLNLKRINFPTTKFAIGNYCFQGCSGLTGTLIIPDCVTTIGGGVFTQCTNIEEIQISENMATITRSFVGMRNLKKIVLKRSSVPVLVAEDAFGGASRNLKIHVPANILSEYKVAQNWETYADKFEPLP